MVYAFAARPWRGDVEKTEITRKDIEFIGVGDGGRNGRRMTV